jgi:hypothetical protein
MGMSQDFELAIEEGATMVRVGTGLFGNQSIVSHYLYLTPPAPFFYF